MAVKGVCISCKAGSGDPNCKVRICAKEKYGGRDIHSPMFMASVSKLFVISCILILREQKKLSLDDLAGKYLDKTTLDGLHVSYPATTSPKRNLLC